jgi:O6-methylguanine-DNA--protein-cysteine methyltransferase
VTLDGANLVALGKVIAKSTPLLRFWAFASTAGENDVLEFFKHFSERESQTPVNLLLFQKIKNEEVWNLARKMAAGTSVSFTCVADRYA